MTRLSAKSFNFPELFPDDSSRAVTNAMRQAFQLVAMVISIALTPLVAQYLGFGRTALIYGLLGGAVILYMIWTSRETADLRLIKKPSLVYSVKTLVINRKFWIAGLTNAFYSAAMSLVMASLPFFVKYTLQIPDSQATILFGTVLPADRFPVFPDADQPRFFLFPPLSRQADQYRSNRTD